MESFIDRCLAGEAGLEDIDDAIDEWHDSASSVGLHEFLGMTHAEYALWVEQESMLPHILAARRFNRPIPSNLDVEQLRAAARAVSAEEERRVMEWLRRTDRI